MNFFVTGSTGFLGKSISSYLLKENVSVALPDRINLFSELVKYQEIDMLIHAAGKAHSTSTTKEETQAFFEVNFELTKRITESIDECKVEVNTLVFISTVAVYGLEEGFEINEDAALNGNSPYAHSKRMAEEHLQQWAKVRGVNLVILRLPLVFGENAPGNLGAMERAIKGRYYFQIGRGIARRSMVHVKQLAEFIPTLIGKSGFYNLTDGYHPTYAEVAEFFGKQHNRRIKSLSLDILNPIATLGNVLPRFPLNTSRLSKLNQTLTFNDEKARNDLKWSGSNVLKQV